MLTGLARSHIRSCSSCFLPPLFPLHLLRLQVTGAATPSLGHCLSNKVSISFNSWIYQEIILKYLHVVLSQHRIGFLYNKFFLKSLRHWLDHILFPQQSELGHSVACKKIINTNLSRNISASFPRPVKFSINSAQ